MMKFKLDGKAFLTAKDKIKFCILEGMGSDNRFQSYISIGAVMVSLLVSSAVDHGFESRSGQPKDYKIGI
jgi:hypothetical protein